MALCLYKLVTDVEVMEYLQVEETVLSLERTKIIVTKSCLGVMMKRSPTSSVLDASFTDIIVNTVHMKDVLVSLQFNWVYFYTGRRNGRHS